jgi:Tripartite tricarboxylate transporter TctB family
MTRSRRDVVVAVAFAALAAVFLVEGRGLPFESRGIPGPGLFPFLLSLTILVFSAALLVSALRGGRAEQPRVGPGDFDLTPTAVADESGLVSEDEDDAPRSLLRPLALWLLVLVVCLGLPVIGFLPAMIVLTLVLTVGMERRRDPISLLSAVAVPVFFYFLFATLLEVRLPAGLFG